MSKMTDRFKLLVNIFTGVAIAITLICGVAIYFSLTSNFAYLTAGNVLVAILISLSYMLISISVIITVRLYYLIFVDIDEKLDYIAGSVNNPFNH